MIRTVVALSVVLGIAATHSAFAADKKCDVVGYWALTINNSDDTLSLAMTTNKNGSGDYVLCFNGNPTNFKTIKLNADEWEMSMYAKGCRAHNVLTVDWDAGSHCASQIGTTASGYLGIAPFALPAILTRVQ
jgi:hypothetical protein